MKKILLVFILFAFAKANVFAQLPDLPTSATFYQPTSMATGSYVIAMDNTNQGTGGFFNEKAYGLLVYLLNNNVKLKWVIQPGKAKDGIDFTVNATLFQPTVGGAASFNFKAGPFVIFAGDTTGVAALIVAYNSLSTTGTKVNVYKTNAVVTVDVRYDYFINGVVWKPKAAVLDDGGNGDIHAAYFVLSGIAFGANGTLTLNNGKLSGTATAATNWSIETTPNFLTHCYTFASEPHNATPTTAVLDGIATFVNGGGNFLAQCEAVRAYENAKRFQATNANAALPVFEKGAGGEVLATVGVVTSAASFPEPDLSFTQFEGGFDMNYAGSLRNWRLTAGSSFTGNGHNEINGSNGTLGNVPAAYGASVTKVASIPVANLGGMVFYLSQHLFSDNTADVEVINGFRMYMNAFMTPTNPQGSLVSTTIFHCSASGSENTVTVSSSSGPTAAYPLKFIYYKDNSPSGFGPEDTRKDSITFATAGLPAVTLHSGLFAGFYILGVRIIPNTGCLQPISRIQLCSTLPMTLMSFTATRNSSMVNLKWTTSSEQNNSGFNIERILGNGNWETIGFVASLAPAGNSNDALTYTYVDPNNFKGISQYRLRQVDFDNHSKISEIRIVRGQDQKGSGVLVYPNPSQGIVNVVFEDNSNSIRDVSLNDMIGRTIKQWKGISTNNIQIDNLTPGMYSLRVVNRDTGEQTVEKIVVNKR